MTRVLVTHAGGRLGIGVGRALKASGEPIHVVGVDTNAYQLQRAVADERFLVPRANEQDYLAILRDLIHETTVDVIWPNHEAEIALIAKSTAYLDGVGVLLPPPGVVQRCQDKMASYECLHRAGIPAPRSMLVVDEHSLEEAFEAFGVPVWVRAIRGAGGKGSRPVSNVKTAALWIDLHKGWGEFMAAECLSNHTITWESIWNQGELILAQGRERLYWEFSSMTPSGVTGICGAVQWLSDRVVDQIGTESVLALAGSPHGIFSVDITSDNQGNPRVTEVNCGRFMSGGIVHFPQCGYNVASIVTRLAMGRAPGFDTPVIGPCPLGTVLIHGMDVEPVVTTAAEIRADEAQLNQRRGEKLIASKG